MLMRATLDISMFRCCTPGSRPANTRLKVGFPVAQTSLSMVATAIGLEDVGPFSKHASMALPFYTQPPRPSWPRDRLSKVFTVRKV